MVDYPVAIIVISFVAMWLATRAGIVLAKNRKPMETEEREYFTIVLTATLTMLGLIIGFTFSMAVSRYDLRKHYEEAEANAIGTEYVRAGLFPAEERPEIRERLKKYLDLRLRFYEISLISPGDARRLRQVNADTAQLQNQMWSMVENSSGPHGTATMALVASGMNDVLNSQGYAQAASWNRVPAGAWILMGLIAVCCNFLMGFGAQRVRPLLLLVLPVLIAISFFLIADIDSSRSGIIRVRPDNLLSLAKTLNAG